MKILFLGYLVNPELASHFSGISVAGNKMQFNVLNCLKAYKNLEIKSVTICPVATFPNEKKIWFGNKEVSVSQNLTSYRVSFLNLPIIKQVWQMFSVYNYAKKHIDKETMIFTFNLFPQVGVPMMWLKKKFGCKTCCLLADLPIDDDPNDKNIFRKFLRGLFDKKTIKAIGCCDKFIALNKHAIEKYAPNKPYIVVEGGVEPEKLINVPTFAKKTKKNIVYSGALTEYSGILELIKAMKYVNSSDAILEIYGGGYLTDQIKRIANESNNIEYCGKVTNEEMLKIQQKAFLLVNPRPVNDPISQVTFPSKLFEYMISGTPVLTTRLNGLDEYYLKYLFIADKDEARGLAAGINTVLSTSQEELLNKARGAFNFIVAEKNWEKQCRKIFDFLISNTQLEDS